MSGSNASLLHGPKYCAILYTRKLTVNYYSATHYSSTKINVDIAKQIKIKILTGSTKKFWPFLMGNSHIKLYKTFWTFSTNVNTCTRNLLSFGRNSMKAQRPTLEELREEEGVAIKVSLRVAKTGGFMTTPSGFLRFLGGYLGFDKTQKNT